MQQRRQLAISGAAVVQEEAVQATAMQEDRGAGWAQGWRIGAATRPANGSRADQGLAMPRWAVLAAALAPAGLRLGRVSREALAVRCMALGCMGSSKGLLRRRRQRRWRPAMTPLMALAATLMMTQLWIADATCLSATASRATAQGGLRRREEGQRQRRAPQAW